MRLEGELERAAPGARGWSVQMVRTAPHTAPRRTATPTVLHADAATANFTPSGRWTPGPAHASCGYRSSLSKGSYHAHINDRISARHANDATAGTHDAPRAGGRPLSQPLATRTRPPFVSPPQLGAPHLTRHSAQTAQPPHHASYTRWSLAHAGHQILRIVSQQTTIPSSSQSGHWLNVQHPTPQGHASQIIFTPCASARILPATEFATATAAANSPERALRRRAGWRTPRKAERSPHRRRLHPITAGSIIIIIIIIWQRRPTAP